MVITPSSYDPYTSNISFVQLNKQRRGELARQPTSHRIYNNFFPPQTVRINILENGNINSKPKLFIWRKWKGGRIEDLLEEAGRHLGHEVMHVYDEDGKMIKNPVMVSSGRTYIFGTTEPFDPRTVNSMHRLTPIQQSSYPTFQDNQLYRPRKLRSFLPKNLYNLDGNERRNPPRSRLPTVSDNFPTSKLNADMSAHRMSVQHSEVSDSARQQDNDQDIAGMFADLEFKDREMLAKHKTKFAGRRSESATIFNRNDQLSYLIYVFLNGDGTKCQHVNLTRIQLDSGMSYVLEAVANKLNVAPSRLANLDGQTIRSVDELLFKGAYVLVPLGQKFHETIYLLPSNAIDTGSNIQNIKARQLHQTKRFQYPNMKLPLINRSNNY